MFQMYPSNFNFLLKNSVANHQNFKLHPFFQLPTIKISKQPKNFYYSILATSPQINSYSQSHLYYSKTTHYSRRSLLLNLQFVIRIHVHDYPVRQTRLPGTANTITRYGKHDYPVRQPRLRMGANVEYASNHYSLPSHYITRERIAYYDYYILHSYHFIFFLGIVQRVFRIKICGFFALYNF